MSCCNLCRGTKLLPLIDFGCHPVAKHYLDRVTDKPAVWPVKLSFCESCGLSQLLDSCPPEVLYENYFTVSSWKNQPHVQHELDVIQSLAGIDCDSRIIEIGSNDGMFLAQLRDRGFKKLLGIEPTKDAYDLATKQGLETIHAFLSPALSASIVQSRGQCDLLISRQNFEHISDLPGVIESIQVLLKPGGYVFVEVPDFGAMMQRYDYALWEEHVNYFTIDTVRYLLHQAGIELLQEEYFSFSGSDLFVVGRRSGNTPVDGSYLPRLRGEALEYAEQWPLFRSRFLDFCSATTQSGNKLAVYGAGSRTFCLINFTGVAPFIDVILDDQAEKQHKYMPGGGIPILPGEELYSRNIAVCLLAVNEENEEKVIRKHERWTQSGGRFCSILPPSSRLPLMWPKRAD